VTEGGSERYAKKSCLTSLGIGARLDGRGWERTACQKKSLDKFRDRKVAEGGSKRHVKKNRLTGLGIGAKLGGREWEQATYQKKLLDRLGDKSKARWQRVGASGTFFQICQCFIVLLLNLKFNTDFSKNLFPYTKLIENFPKHFFGVVSSCDIT
jgi:hypothetical protein